MTNLIKSMDEFENIKKTIMVLRNTVRVAAIGATMLDNKVEMQRLYTKIDNIDRELRLQYYSVEDAISFAKNTDQCPECLTTNQKAGMSEIEYLNTQIDRIRDLWGDKHKIEKDGYVCVPKWLAEELEHLLNDSEHTKN